MKLFSVYNKSHIGVNEKCLLTPYGDYIGQNTGNLYKKTDGFYHRKQEIALIVNIDHENDTGMYYLDNDINNHKIKYLNCYVTLKKAHYSGSIQVYYCLELKEYFSENEIKLLTIQEIRNLKMEKILNL